MLMEERVDLFAELVLSCHGLYYTRYDGRLTLLDSNNPDQALFTKMFFHGETGGILRAYTQHHKKPLVYTGETGLVWLISPDLSEGEVRYYYVFGPFFFDEQDLQSLSAPLEKLELSPSVMHDVLHVLRQIPVVSPMRINEYAIMLHQCVHREKISFSDIHVRNASTSKSAAVEPAPMSNAHGTYRMEQEMLRMVREGNLDFRKHMAKLALTGRTGTLANNSLRQTKNSILTSIVLFSRAAIDGGLSPETAVTLADHYFQAVEATTNTEELYGLALQLQHDFVRRVHDCRSSMLSQPIRECCEYICLHLEEELTLKGLAARLNYSEYYLSHRFKQELGVNMKEYIRTQRLERAKLLLQDPSQGVKEISEQLRFCSQSYFSESFRKEYGMTPSDWREKINKE